MKFPVFNFLLPEITTSIADEPLQWRTLQFSVCRRARHNVLVYSVTSHSVLCTKIELEMYVYFQSGINIIPIAISSEVDVDLLKKVATYGDDTVHIDDFDGLEAVVGTVVPSLCVKRPPTGNEVPR